MLGDFYDKLKEAAEGVDPVGQKFKKKHAKMVDTLLEAGFKKNDIIEMVYLYKTDVKNHIEDKNKALKTAKAMVKKLNLDNTKEVIKPVEKP